MIKLQQEFDGNVVNLEGPIKWNWAAINLNSWALGGSSSHTSFNSAGEEDKVLSEHKGLIDVTAVWPCHQQMSLQKPECLGRSLCFWPEIQTSVHDVKLQEQLHVLSHPGHGGKKASGLFWLLKAFQQRGFFMSEHLVLTNQKEV